MFASILIADHQEESVMSKLWLGLATLVVVYGSNFTEGIATLLKRWIMAVLGNFSAIRSALIRAGCTYLLPDILGLVCFACKHVLVYGWS